MRDGFASERHIKKPLVAANELSPSVKDDSPSVKDNSSSVNRITKKDRMKQILEYVLQENLSLRLKSANI